VSLPLTSSVEEQLRESATAHSMGMMYLPPEITKADLQVRRPRPAPARAGIGARWRQSGAHGHSISARPEQGIDGARAARWACRCRLGLCIGGSRAGVRPSVSFAGTACVCVCVCVWARAQVMCGWYRVVARAQLRSGAELSSSKRAHLEEVREHTLSCGGGGGGCYYWRAVHANTSALRPIAPPEESQPRAHPPRHHHRRFLLTDARCQHGCGARPLRPGTASPRRSCDR
jgi:hypothetical protein